MLSGLLVGLSTMTVVLLCAMVVGGVAVLVRELGRALGRRTSSVSEVRLLEQLWALDAVEPHDRWRG